MSGKSLNEFKNYLKKVTDPRTPPTAIYSPAR